jgi:uncharacterized membrane protein YbhN (UPF0104 family)
MPAMCHDRKGRAAIWHRLFFGLAPKPSRRIVARMGFLDNALSLITLLSLFLLGPALGRALVARFDGWQNWSLPSQHVAVGICTMIAVTGMVLVYGALWKLSPKSVAWYTWIQEVPVAGSVNLTGPVDIRQPSKK